MNVKNAPSILLNISPTRRQKIRLVTAERSTACSQINGENAHDTISTEAYKVPYFKARVNKESFSTLSVAAKVPASCF